MSGLASQSADDLNSRRAGAHHRDPFAPQRNIMIPPRRVEHRTRESVQTRDLWIPGMMQDPGRGDQEIEFLDIALGGTHPPMILGKLGVPDLGAEPDALTEPEI